ncbi:MAG: T9SS type A sorting domain-containing protein [Saprospiraceae bacterium]|nr:T9SS type A sorting domain-containing protein [Saprospiraceae bacterium]
MKKLLVSTALFCTLFLYSPIGLRAQSNFPFPTTYGEWHYRTVLPVIGPNDLFRHRRDIVEGDSVFNGKLYAKVYTQNLCECDCSSQNGSYTQPLTGQSKSLVGGVREEAGKVYFTTFGKPPFNSYFRPVLDTLMFDFTLNVGDSLDYASNIRFSVEKVDTTAEGRRRVHLLAYNGPIPKTVVWTEGIGFDWGLFSTSFWVKDFIYFTGFSCFNTTPDVCGIPCVLSAVNELDQTDQIKLFPTFAEDELFLALGDGFDKIQGEVYAVDGRRVELLDTPGKTLRIPVSHWPKGMYYFVLLDESGQKNIKSYLR